MFKTAQEAISYIESQRTKRTFSRFQELILRYQIPMKLPYTIHIAGTNGKGSTIQYVKEILREHGYRVGSFTSPYMIHHNDRFCINGEPISDEKLVYYILKYYDIIEKEKLSMFEIDTLIMLAYFSTEELDFVIIETGIGGKNDKTNIITSDITAITNISYDHQELLGETLQEIALQKAGIIKQHQIFITTEKNEEILKIFTKICLQKQTTIEIVSSKEGDSFDYQGQLYRLPIASYQVYNAKLAVAIANRCIILNPVKVQRALQNAICLGRFERIGKIYLDGAHNPAGIQALIDTLAQQKWKNICIIFSALADKDSEKMRQLLKGYPVHFASFQDERVHSQEPRYQDVYQEIKDQYDIIVFTGSLHFISSVRKYIKTITAI